MGEASACPTPLFCAQPCPEILIITLLHTNLAFGAAIRTCMVSILCQRQTESGLLFTSALQQMRLLVRRVDGQICSVCAGRACATVVSASDNMCWEIFRRTQPSQLTELHDTLGYCCPVHHNSRCYTAPVSSVRSTSSQDMCWKVVNTDPM